MYAEIKSYLDSRNVQLIAVSKMRTIDEVMALYQLGQRHFAENRVQDLIEKYETLPKDIHWHLIGHLQKNKVKYIAPFVYMIHSVDDIELLKKVNQHAEQNHRIIKVLLQVHIAEEETKFGFSEAEILSIFTPNIQSFHNVEICGLMGMATNTNNQEKIKSEFKSLSQLFENIKINYNFKNVHFTEISMGMSSDYKLAIDEGATMVRIGTALFS
ncbi:MAG: YggS family pyridoxal phosphate-dependent enzyme [Saprospiraceae bacterium]